MDSVTKTLDILELFLDDNRGELGLLEIAEASGLSKSAVHRIVAVLIKRNYLIQKRKRGKYSLGLKFLDYSGFIKSRIKIREIAIPIMEELSEKVNESVNLGVWYGNLTVHTDIVHSSTHSLKIFPGDGEGFSSSIYAAHATGIGKVLLAYLPEKELQKALNKYGFNLSVDGILGSRTEAAICEFQERNGLKVDGIAGPRTRRALGLQ